MALIRSIIHMLWMAITVVPYTLAIVLGSLFGARGTSLYRIARAWLSICVHSARPLLGIQYRVTGMEHLPQGEKSGAVLLCKHQSTYETFLMPAIMPHPLAYVFKKELLYVPFFGWSIGRLDMIHIDRSLRAKAFHKVVQQGKALLAKGTWVIMFPEGTRVERGQKGQYKSGGTRLAIDTGVPVIPIAVTSAKVWPRKAFIKKPGVVDVSIGPAIASAGRQPDELMREVEAWIEAEMRRLDPEAYPAEPKPLAAPEQGGSAD
ncbi:lysophospholipid acyltransferase family protein [Acidovorax temperans]|uniref:lysophospholipid acyltransferase family protein n=1 Tax=Acidovorax temperans TaxID=80878 RepID=UPI00289A0611|nr:lysophospholipid acyltransferase family protein [Acidovorax temperans]